MTRVLSATKQDNTDSIAGIPITETEIEMKRNALNYDLNFNSETEYSHQGFEIELDTKYPTVKGRLKLRMQFWRDTILETIKHGYKIPFLVTLKTGFFRRFYFSNAKLRNY